MGDERDMRGTQVISDSSPSRPTLLVLASTYPRWTGDPEPGFVHELSRRLVGHFKVVVLCPHAEGAPRHEIMDGVEIFRYRYAPEKWETLVNDGGIVTNLRRQPWKALLLPGFLLAQALGFRSIVRKRGISVVHAHWLIPQGVLCAYMTLIAGTGFPYLVTSHGADLYALKGRLLDSIKRTVADRAAAVSVVSQTMSSALVQLGVDPAKISVMPMGVDITHRFTTDGRVVRSSEEILFVGRLVEKKGVRHLLSALPLVLERHPRTRITIAGFGPEEAALKTQAQTLGITGQVDFIGAVSQSALPDLYRRASVFVAPFVQATSGDQEGLGLVLVEALGCGCPVVAGDVPAIHDLPVERVDAAAHKLLANAIVRVLDDPAGFADNAMARREMCLQQFDWTAVAAGYARKLSSIVPVLP